MVSDYFGISLHRNLVEISANPLSSWELPLMKTETKVLFLYSFHQFHIYKYISHTNQVSKIRLLNLRVITFSNYLILKHTFLSPTVLAAPIMVSSVMHTDNANSNDNATGNNNLSTNSNTSWPI